MTENSCEKILIASGLTGIVLLCVGAIWFFGFYEGRYRTPVTDEEARLKRKVVHWLHDVPSDGQRITHRYIKLSTLFDVPFNKVCMQGIYGTQRHLEDVADLSKRRFRGNVFLNRQA